MKQHLIAAIAFNAASAQASAESPNTVWVQIAFTQPSDLYHYEDELLYSGRDNLSINGNTYSVNTTRTLFKRVCTGSPTNDPPWMTDVSSLQIPELKETLPLVGNGTFNTGVYWGIEFSTRNTYQAFQTWDVENQTYGNEVAARSAEERFEQRVWAYGK
ncbi:MAG: hypothetical protein JNM28_03645 [Armatimonadetes bacterium]|nr:hypothetical protein [Armatimonadota bacterium]